MSNIWITSDTHFGHRNIAGSGISDWKDGYRDFDSVEKMDKTLITNINKYVKEDDVLWHLGDFSFGGHTKIPSYRNSLNVREIFLILGNHDENVHKYQEVFSGIYNNYIGSLGQQYFTLYHYAMRVWDKSHRGSLHCYGHSHNSLENHPYGRSMDVGVDSAYAIFGEYRPFHINEIVKILENRPVAFVDHHQKTD